MALPLYAITLFVSAFILFLVQPIVGKIILPKLGGTPQVWNTCMVFFQMVLLAGYAYTHNAVTRLTLRQQLIAHVLLLALPLIILLPFPFALGGHFVVDPSTGDEILNPRSLWGFRPELGSNPMISTLAILFTYAALPFLFVSTTAPLLQKWFVHTGHPASKDPYFLYGASNLGSMLSLIIYPILIEPYLKLAEQGWMYTFGYLFLTAFVLACAAMVWNSKEVIARPHGEHKPEHAPSAPTAPTTAETGITAVAPGAPPAPVPAPTAATSVKPGAPPHRPKGGGKTHAPEQSIALPSEDVSFARRARWIVLAAIPSSLMLGITTHITTDLSPIPIFWLIPLILYLGSFILVFMTWPIRWTEQAHPYVLFIQPVGIFVMIMADVLNLAGDTRFLVGAIAAHVFGFFATTMLCHGELAKDRPSTKHLTEFYLCMSIGGMLGGMFNALIAPIVFKLGAWEFPLAIFASAIARPKMFDTGFLDNFFAAFFESQPDQPAKPVQKGAKHIHAPTSVTANESLVSTLDIAWPVVIVVIAVVLSFVVPRHTAVGRIVIYGVPLALACICLARPIRIGLGVGIILLAQVLLAGDADKVYTDRSYFGLITVRQEDRAAIPYRQLTHGHINHGLNFLPPKEGDRGKPEKDFSRLATTYYHREGPVGRVMEGYNWFKGPPNTYWADARMPANLVTALCADATSPNSVPMAAFAAAWSEPPIATIGLGTGTMASYGRPYQHVHFYEIDNLILRLNLGMPTRKILNYKQYSDHQKNAVRQTWFNYLDNAIARGSSVQVLMGDARLRMALPYRNHYLSEINGEPDDGGGPEGFYHMMVVDAFSSDAIPAHLLTKEAFQMYFNRLSKHGILCVHTSNRFVDLPKVVGAVSADLGLHALRGHDVTVKGDQEKGHYNSEWVMVARTADDLKVLTRDTDFLAEYRRRTQGQRRDGEDYWESVDSEPRYVWTDDYYNLLSVVRFRAR